MLPNNIFKHGITVFLKSKDDWRSENFKAYIQPLRYKNKIYLEGNYTEIGKNDNEIFMYLGPSSHDLTNCLNEVRIFDMNNREFFIDKAEKVMLDDCVFYIWAIIRLVRSEE